jgi:putative membrane protein
MTYNSDRVPTTNRSKTWLKLGITAALIAAGYLFLRNWDYYGSMNGFRGAWPMARGGYDGHMMGFGSGYGMGIGMLVFWGLIVFAIVSLITGSFSKSGHSNTPEGHFEDALEILKKRYARGEIDKTEFDAKRRDLKA